ncbi:MAG: acyl-CoA/acyl-ACP dehydrogenase [Planctomycetes bacterium]|nr:acyl-CoA/acyl-ACP dehydrogenase [Planctomycetota bacterium]
MSFLKRERSTLAEFMPGLDEALAKLPLMEMEKPGSAALSLFRKAGGPGLLIPARFGGRGATPLQVIHVQRALAARSPSLAIATTMHHFSVASVIGLAELDPERVAEILALIAGQNLLMASGFAEGRSGVSVLWSGMQVKRVPGGLVINGSKKPCSLAASMDLFTAGVLVPTESGMPHFAVIAIPANTAGLERKPFWGTSILGGAESDEVILREAYVPDEQAFYYSNENPALLELSFLWFEMVITVSYLGVASALVERVLNAAKGTATERTRLAIEIEGAATALEGIARAMMAGESGNDALAQVLFVRYAAQAAIGRITALAAELLGGMAFICSSDVGYLLAATTALAFHPPSRLSLTDALDAYLSGQRLNMS